jgi:hypothetical protein
MDVRPAQRTRSTFVRQIASEISRTTPDERADLLDFRARMYGPKSVYADPAWVRWLYDEPPMVATTGAALWTFRHEGRIEGQQGAILSRVRLGNSERSLAWALDLMVSPAQRMRGIGAVLTDVALRGIEAAATTEVSLAAQKALARAGWNHIGDLPQWVLVLDPAAFLRHKAHPVLGRMLGSPARSILTAARMAARALAMGRKLVPMAEFDERADAVWNRCARAWPIVACRDQRWLAWRWDACPRRRGAFGVWLNRGTETLGWAMLRIGEHRGLPAGFILDLFCPPNELRALLALCAAELSKKPIAAIYCLLRAPGASAALAVNGFLRRNSGFAMMCHSQGLPAGERQLMADSNQWFVTAGDSDLDRPRDSTVYA